MKHLKRFNEAEEYIYGNPAFPSGYLEDAMRRRKIQIQEQGRGAFNVAKAQSLIRGSERQLEELLTKTINKIYYGLIERYNITFDIKFGEHNEIKDLLISPSNESFREEKWKRKVANLITQGEAKNMMHVIHSPEITEGVKQIFGEQKGRELINTWSDIVKSVDIIDMNRDINYFNMSYITSTIMGVVKIDWTPRDEDINEDKDEDDLFEDPFDEEWENELFDALKKNNEERVDDIIEKENLPEDTVRKKFNPKIIVRGADFTLLIHESIKGLYNVLSLAGIPKDKEIARKVVGDLEQSLREEPEEFKWGPIVAADLRDFLNEYPDIDKYPNMREEFWLEVLRLPTNEFFPVINAILSKSEEGKIKSNVIFKRVIKKIGKFKNKKAGVELKKLLKIHKERLTPIVEASLKKGVKKATLTKQLLDKGYDAELVRSLIAEIAERLGIVEQPTRRPERQQPTPIQEPESQEVDYSSLTLNQLNDLQNQAIDDGDYQKATEIANEIDSRRR